MTKRDYIVKGGENMTNFTKVSQVVLDEAMEVYNLCSNENREPSEVQCATAGLDPEVMNAAVNITLSKVSSDQSLMLAVDPGIGIMLGITLAASFINNKKNNE